MKNALPKTKNPGAGRGLRVAEMAPNSAARTEVLETLTYSDPRHQPAQT